MSASGLAPAITHWRYSPRSQARSSLRAKFCCILRPGDAGYGSALLGYHYYTWAFIGFAVAIALTAIALLFDRQFAQADLSKPAAAGLLARAAVWLVIALVALNVVSTLLECGFAACPDNPVSYQLLKSTR
jgi:hypothetical protein